MPAMSKRREPEPSPDDTVLDGQAGTFDDWRWHVEGQFPTDQAPEQAYVHIGLFVAWLACRGLLDPGWVERAGLLDRTIALAERRSEPCALLEGTQGRLTRPMLSPEGAAFASAYYAPQYGYPSDWRRVFGRPADRYDVPGDWETYDRVAAVVDGRYAAWIKAGRPELMPLPGVLGTVARFLRPPRA
jgi:hypothetical protein